MYEHESLEIWFPIEVNQRRVKGTVQIFCNGTNKIPEHNLCVRFQSDNLVVNGVNYRCSMDFYLTETGWKSQRDYIRKVDIFAGDPSWPARDKISQLAAEMVPEWIKNNPDKMKRGEEICLNNALNQLQSDIEEKEQELAKMREKFNTIETALKQLPQ